MKTYNEIKEGQHKSYKSMIAKYNNEKPKDMDLKIYLIKKLYSELNKKNDLFLKISEETEQNANKCSFLKSILSFFIKK